MLILIFNILDSFLMYICTKILLPKGIYTMILSLIALTTINVLIVLFIVFHYLYLLVKIMCLDFIYIFSLTKKYYWLLSFGKAKP